MNKLTFQCYLETSGGPFCLARGGDISGWTGIGAGGDYFKVCELVQLHPKSTIVDYVFGDNKEAFVLNFERANALLFRSLSTLAILEVKFAEDGWRIPFRIDVRLGSEMRSWRSYGDDSVVIFDSALPGLLLPFLQEGCSKCLDTTSFNVGFFSLEPGDWIIHQAMYETTEFLSEGVVFIRHS